MNKKNQRPNVAYPQATVGQRVEAPLEVFRTTFGGRIRFNQSISQYFWILNGSNVFPALEEMLPHLQVKHRQAQLAIEWARLGTDWLADNGKVQAGRNGYPAIITERRLEILNGICQLNGRGGRVVSCTRLT